MIQRLHARSREPGQEPVNVKQLCHLLGVSRSGYYDHLRKNQRMRCQQDQQLGQQVETLFHANRQAYGSPHLVDALRKHGIRCGKNRIRRLMKERGSGV